MAADLPLLHPGLRYYGPLPEGRVPQTVETDVCVYGGHSGGIIAALQAARMGRTVALAAFDRNLGGLTASGLGATDIGNKAAIGGLSREFYRRVGVHYGQEEAWTFEPHVAARVFEDWLREAGVPVYRDMRLTEVRLTAVSGGGGRISELVMDDGSVFRARVFIDATYEGDLMALAGVSYHVGREANAIYDETFNGVFFGHPNHNFLRFVDPYRTPGDARSGLLPEIAPLDESRQGDGDRRVQAYNFRMCLTDVPENRIPFPQPPGYDPARYELLARTIHAGIFDMLQVNLRMPGGKTDTNNSGGFSTDFIGGSDDWPEADYAARERLFQEHVNYVAGFFHFLCHDESLPLRVRETCGRWGLARDEFPETGGWPHQLYVREARRLVSDYVMTEHDCVGRVRAADAVGLAAYTMDSHNCRRTVRAGRVVNEGNVEIGGFEPYPISYRSLVPRVGECTNLLAPFCLSASHVAFGSIRMEPVFMVLGQSAATAAVLSLDADCAVQDVDYPALRRRLRDDGQVLDWRPPH